MNRFHSTPGQACLVLGLAFLLAADLIGAEKPIRLRHPIQPIEGQGGGQGPVVPQGPGLFLVQFEGAVQPVWRQICQNLGARFIRYVPEDAFILRVDPAGLVRLRALPFVTRVARYEPVHKRGPGLPAPGQGGGGAALARTPVSILCDFGAPGPELARVRALLQGNFQERATRVGLVIEGVIDPALLDRLLQLEGVLWVEPAPRIQLFDEESTKIVAGDDGFRGTLALLHQRGLDGSGVTVAVADSGLDNGDSSSMHPDLFGRVRGFFFYSDLEDASDEHGHGTHVAGIVAGNAALGEKDDFGALYGLGVAPRAQIVGQRIFDGVGNYKPPPSFGRLTRDAVRAGAEIGSNSWGDDTRGRYDLSAMEFDALVRDADELIPGDQPYILEFSAGNAGPGFQTIGSPAVGKNVIATGASQNNRQDLFIYADGQEAMADFSSRGPCEDGRIKPDLVAPGTWIASLQSGSATDENAWLGISPNYQYQGGTSQSGPHVSGGAAIFVQFYRQSHNATPSPALVKAALINSAVDMDDEIETGPVPNEDEGWGRMDLANLFLSDRQYQFIEQEDLLSTGQTFEHRVVVGDPAEPLKITLVYTDVPGLPAAIPALVNDLDLEVIGPDGRFYRGNQLAAGESAPNPAGTDSINNVEAVHLSAPVPGEYVVRVHGRNVPEDAVQQSPAIDQDFALVVSARLPLPGVGLVFLDKPAYRAPAQALVRLIDTDLAGQATVVVAARSTTEPTPRPVLLRAAGPSGSFTGAVALVTGPPAADSAVSIAHGDLIEVIYFDASAGANSTATAQGDFIPPLVSGVETFADFGQVHVLFETDEPATSVLLFGPSPNLGLAVTNVTLTDEHELPLPPLLPGQTYYLAILAADAAGNVSSNDNGGLLFQFQAPEVAAVLLVDSYYEDLFEIPPLSGYLHALEDAGLSYDVYDAATRGSPTLEDLRPYRVVMWRLPEFGNTLTPAEMQAITNYLNEGGSLFVGSMEVLSRIDFAGFGTFNRDTFQVESFIEDVGVPEIQGVPGDPMTEGLSLVLDYSPYQDEFKELVGLPADASDIFTPTTNAVPIFLSDGEPAGLRFPAPGVDSPGRVVFLSFPLDAIPRTGPGPNTRGAVLRRIVDFLTPLEGASQLRLDRLVYTIPSSLTIEVTDLDQAGLGPIHAHVNSDSDPAGQTVALEETVRRGLFRGRVTLTDAGSGGEEVLVSPSDTVRVSYLDVSSGQQLTAQATIEIVPPEISGVEHETGYVDAIIRWETSEPGDSLVQFGESILFERTAYTRGLRTVHEVLVTGLLPDRIYYYRVVSRDQAGNAGTDRLLPPHYSFRTLRPLQADWQDDLESSTATWTVIDGELTELSWEHGPPRNGRTAHSPSQVWGSNLGGVSSGFVESFLVSPPVLLSGGNVATLQFWQQYDFTIGEFDILEGGEVLLITNVATAPLVLGTFLDSSGGWEPAQFDLTPHIDQLVYVVWHYVLFSFEDRPRIGWMIDDISITMSNVVNGTITIANNLAQASFILEGPISRSTQGRFLEIANARPGQYQISYGEVPYYDSPAPQEATLVSGGSILFEGEYTFPDINSNGMSDVWEQAYFNAIDPGRTSTTDTDADGRTDLDEFMAGTDPTRSESVLVVALPELLPDGRVRLQWVGAVKHAYRVQSSTDGTTWEPVSEWLTARVNGPMTHTILPPAGNGLFLMRVEVSP